LEPDQLRTLPPQTPNPVSVIWSPILCSAPL